MGTTSKSLVPARPGQDDATGRIDGTGRALQVRDPMSGFFHGLQAKATTRALDRHTGETEAFTRNMNAQTEAVRSMVRLRDAVDEYRVRDELAALHYENARSKQLDAILENEHAREIRRKGREREQLDADRGVFNADYGLDLQRRSRGSETERRRKERELRDLNLSAEITLTRDALGNYGSNTPNGTPSMEMARAQLLEAYREAVAAGDEDEAARINAALDVLDGKR
jgi:hypothetical protein